MDNYEKLLKEIKIFLCNEKIESDEEIISLYDLYVSMNECFEKLRKLSVIDDIFVQKLSTSRKYLFGKYDKFFIKDSFCVDIYGDEKISKINFSNSDTEDSDNFYSINIIKDKDKKDLYLDKKRSFDNKQIYKFIKKNFDMIYDTLLTIEEYSDLFGMISSKENELINFNGSNNLFDYRIVYNKKGFINIYNNISKNHLLYDEYDKTYLQKESIHEFVKENEIEILKRIPIDIELLPENILNIYTRGKKYQLEKELTKMIHWWN